MSIARHPKRKRRYKTPRCIRRCRRPQAVLDLCRSHAREEADRLFSLRIRERDGECSRCWSTADLQCAHVVSRRYLATRYLELNAHALCLRCHKWETEHPLEGRAFWRTALGPYVLDELERIALTGAAPDMAVVLARLRGVDSARAEGVGGEVAADG